MIIDKFIEQIAKDSKTVIPKDSIYASKLKNRIKNLLDNDKLRDTIETKLSDLSNWTGTYSEILIISFLYELDLPVHLEKKLSQSQLLLSIKSHALPDIYLKHPYNLYFEVKCFTGVNKAITDNIINAVKKSTNVWKITASYHYDTFFNKGSGVVSQEIKNLKKAIINGANNHHSNNYTSLKYTIYREPVDMTISTHSYNEYRFAEQFKGYVFNHSDQILKDKTNILSFVLSPKFNFNFTSGLDFNVALRALARRVFMELIKDNRKLSELSISWANCNTRLSTIARRITGLLFYIDGIDDMDKVYLFENPNVNKSNQEKIGMKQLKMEFDYEIKDKKFYYDNFEYDNY